MWRRGRPHFGGDIEHPDRVDCRAHDDELPIVNDRLYDRENNHNRQRWWEPGHWGRGLWHHHRPSRIWR
jgi:hypothetical protein